MNEQEFIQKLFSALTLGTAFEGDLNGFKVTASKDDNNITLNITNVQEDLTKKEKEEFEKWLNTIPDQMFMEICEDLATDKLQQIQECLNSKNIESVRSAILKFKSAVKTYTQQKIDDITEKANQEINFYNTFIND